jgi:type VI secretion system secreted protein Hcp
MAVDMFLELDGINGESVDSEHKGKIDILAWSWGIANTGTFQHGSGGGGGKSSFQDLAITKYIDSASPTLMLDCANGAHIAKGKISVRKAGGDKPLEYLTIELTKILISAYNTGGSGGEDRLTENINLNFAEVKVTYTPQTDKGGKDKPQVMSWDIAGHAKK